VDQLHHGMVGGVNDSKLTWRSGGGVVEGKSAK